MKKILKLRISEILMRVMLLIIVCAYVYIKTSNAAIIDMTLQHHNGSAVRHARLQDARAGAVDFDQYPCPGTFYTRKILQPTIYH